MFFWRRVAPQIPEEGLKPTATPGYTRNFRELNDLVSQGKSFSGYERNSLFLNRGGERFVDVGALVGVDFDDDARAVAVVDWDRDGDLDIWVTNRTGPQVRLLRNNHPSAASSVAIRLVGNGTTTSRDAVGARLTLWPASEPQLKQIRTVRAGDGFLAQSSAWSHFGLGQSTDPLQLSVAWPGGGIETFVEIEPGARHTIKQGQGRVARTPRVETEGIRVRAGEPPADPPGRGLWVVNRVPFPELKYTDEAGSLRSSTDFHGKPVLINLWATWCAPCIEELGEFAGHTGDLHSRGATVLALNVDGFSVSGGGTSDGRPEEVLSRLGYELPWGLANQDTVAMMEVLVEFLTSQRVPLPVPTGFLLDAAGNVAAVYFGAIGWEQLAGDLALLDAPPADQLRRASPRAGRWFANPRQIDRAAYLGDYATRFGANNFPAEAQRLFGLIEKGDGAPSAQDHYNQAKTAARQGMVEEAIRHYRAALQIEPEYGQALTGLGAIFLTRKRISEAETLFQQALKIDPNHATALVNLAMIDQARGEKERALGRLEKVIARNPEFAEAHMNIGSLLASEGRYNEAIQHLSKAADLSPRRPAVRLNLATVYMETQHWNEAEKQFQQVLQQSPDLAYAHFGLGTLQARQELHTRAVASYQKAISLGLKTPRSYTRLGLSLLAIGEREAGSEALRAALRLDPRYPAAKQALEEIERRSE